jgi:Zinc carboxypeptidase
MRTLTACFVALTWILLSSTWVRATPGPWTEGLVPDPKVPTPDEFLGRPFAQSPATVDEIKAYCRALAASTDRAELAQMGKSVQGEALLLLSITSPARRAELARRPGDFAVLRDPWHQSLQERRAAARRQVPVVWIGCSVHGDEASGADAGLGLAYRLAADLSTEGRELLDKVVVLIDPMQNPDGRRRFLQHVRSFGRTSNPDPSPWAAEHNQLWPGGRSNHFLFDMNRDWAYQTQPETRARAGHYLRWRPQVFVDLHEMGRRSSYYFPPPSEPINPNVPESVLDWFDAFGRANAKAFEDKGYDYFVRENFDLFYPGYGDSWPTLQGAVGMTFEQASTRGRSMVQRAGRVVGYVDAVAHHYVAARTTVETAATYGDDLMQSVVDFYDQSRRRADADARAEIILDPQIRAGAARKLAQLLKRQGIRVMQTTEPARVRLSSYDLPAPQWVDLPAGSYRIPLRQADYGLLRSLLDPETELDQRFLAQEVERRRRGLQNRFYDVTAWSLVYSYGVQAWSSSSTLRVDSQLFSGDVRVEVSDEDEAYAWLIPYDDADGVAALSDLWKEGIVVATALDALRVEGRDFPRGSFIVPRAANADHTELGATLRRIVRARGLTLYAASSGWSERGPALGSSRVRYLSAPRVGLLTGPGLRSLSAGAQSWLLEERYGVSFTSLLLDRLDEVDLREFDALLLPETERATTLPVERLHRWVEDGGVLVAVGASASALLQGDQEFGSVEVIDDLAELADEDGMLGEFEVGQTSEDDLELLPDDRRVLRTPGAILRVEVDPTHPLSLGQGGALWAPYLSDRLLQPSVAGKNVITVAAEDARAAGFMWPVMEEAVRGKAYLVEERIGRGAAVLFAEDPAFRGVWEGLHRFLLNALLVRPGLLKS